MRAAATAGVTAIVTLDAAVMVIVFGVLVTSGVYGSRLAWLLGVALPLLAITMLLSWLSLRVPRRTGPGVNRAVFVTASALFAIPCALALTLLAVDALALAQHSVGP